MNGSGNVSGPYSIPASFGSGASFWNIGEFVIIDYENCGVGGMLQWRSIALDGSVRPAIDLGYFEPELELHPGLVALNGLEIGLVLNHQPDWWGIPNGVFVMRIDRAGNVLLPPLEIYNSPRYIIDGSFSSEPRMGYALLLSEIPSDSEARVVFLRVDFDGTIRQETYLQESGSPSEIPSFPLFWKDDHFAAGWGLPYKMGSLICR